MVNSTTERLRNFQHNFISCIYVDAISDSNISYSWEMISRGSELGWVETLVLPLFVDFCHDFQILTALRNLQQRTCSFKKFQRAWIILVRVRPPWKTRYYLKLNLGKIQISKYRYAFLTKIFRILHLLLSFLARHIKILYS